MTIKTEELCLSSVHNYGNFKLLLGVIFSPKPPHITLNIPSHEWVLHERVPSWFKLRDTNSQEKQTDEEKTPAGGKGHTLGCGLSLCLNAGAAMSPGVGRVLVVATGWTRRFSWFCCHNPKSFREGWCVIIRQLHWILLQDCSQIPQLGTVGTKGQARLPHSSKTQIYLENMPLLEKLKVHCSNDKHLHPVLPWAK